jgi:RecA/RadA recombinase
MMQQQLILKPALAKTSATKLSFNVPDIDGLFPGFRTGDFAVVFGPQSTTSLISRLCVRAQLPKHLGGLETKVVFIDAANSSSLSNILEAAKLQQIDEETLDENVIHMRAYTAYRLTSLIMEELQETVESSDAKLVVISDIMAPFLSDNVDDQEAKAVYSQIMSYLANFAKKNRLSVIATILPHEGTRRTNMFQEITTVKANTVLRFTKTLYTSEVELEKHPSYMLGVAEYTPEIKKLADYTAVNFGNLLTYIP